MKNRNKNLSELHDGSATWISELEFTKDEQSFLEHLLSTHFLDLSSTELYDTTRKLIGNLKDVETMGDELTTKVVSHNNKIGKALESKKENLDKELNAEHKVLQKDLKNYFLKFRVVKKKIFRVIKDIMAHHKQKLLINKA